MSKNGMLGIGALVIAFGLLVGGCVGVNVMWHKNTEAHITITVTDRERVENRDDDGARYMVWADVRNDDGSTSSETFEVTDSLIRGQFRAADTYGRLHIGGTYDVAVDGWRNGFFSSNRNIYKIERVVERAPDSDS